MSEQTSQATTALAEASAWDRHPALRRPETDSLYALTLQVNQLLRRNHGELIKVVEDAVQEPARCSGPANEWFNLAQTVGRLDRDDLKETISRRAR